MTGIKPDAAGRLYVGHGVQRLVTDAVFGARIFPRRIQDLDVDTVVADHGPSCLVGLDTRRRKAGTSSRARLAAHR